MTNETTGLTFRVTIIVLALILTPPAAASAMSLLLATDDTPGNPWIMGGGIGFQRDRPGIEIELYQHAAKRLNLDLQMVRMPWKRCLTELQAGRLDGVFPASFKPERLAVGLFPWKDGKVDATRKSRDSSYFLYRRKDTPVTWDGRAFVNLEVMQRSTIGVPLGWSIAADLRQMAVDILERPKPVDLLVMLTKGGLAGVVCLDTVADTYLGQDPHRFNTLEKVNPAIADKAYYLMISHRFAAAHPGLADRIWDTIAAIKAEATYTSIVGCYTQ